MLFNDACLIFLLNTSMISSIECLDSPIWLGKGHDCSTSVYKRDVFNNAWSQCNHDEVVITARELLISIDYACLVC